jgi:hypothetical protein
MTIQTGVGKSVRFLVQTGLGTAASGTSTAAQALRRVESMIDLTKRTYESAEKRTDFQVSDFRHGGQSVEGPIRCELSPGTYYQFMENVLRRDFSAITAMSGLSITIAASGSLYTLTRSTGDYLADGLKVGTGIRLTAGAFDAANLNKNLLVVELTATVATVLVMNGTTLTAQGPIASATVTVPGKRTFIPTSGHTNEYFTFEHYYSEIDESEVFVDCRIGTMNVTLPAEGMSGTEFAVMGRTLATYSTGTAPYFTAPTAETTTGTIAGVNGALVINGAAVALLSNLTINVDGGLTTEAVVGSVISPDVFRGRVRVTGEFSAFFESVALRDIFRNETEATIVAAFTTSNAAAGDFISFTLPRVKFGGATKDDPETGIRQRIPYQALFNGSGGSGVKHEKTTIVVQDSAVP